MSLLTATNVDVRLGGRLVLHGLNFTQDAGECVTIVGPNGSGKTTFVRTLIGAERPTAGTVRRRAGLRVGYVPQRLALDPSLPLTVGRFLHLPVRHAEKDAAAALERVGAAGLSNHQMSALSGGQFQRVLLARALLGAPEILVLDEPTQGLDQRGIAAFYDLIDELRHALGCAVLMVSHDLLVVMQASDRVVCLNGHICCEGPPVDVSQAPEYQALFGPAAANALALYQHKHDHGHHHDHADGRPMAGAS